MSKLVFYLFVVPVSYLPFSVLYLMSDALYFMMYYIIGYRKEVIYHNLDLVFQDKSSDEKKHVVKAFYRHLCDLIFEGIKAFNLSNEEIKERYKITGVESTWEHHKEGRDIIVACGHIGNWEWASLACPLIFKHQCAVIITPFSNKFFNNKMSKSRSRNGYDLVPKESFKKYLDKRSEDPKAIFFLSDQSPSNPEKAYWTDFLGVKTPVQFGIEKYSKQLSAPVYYIDVKRVNRGYYQGHISLLIDDPSSVKYGEIIRIVTDRISESIFANPSDWLWSHRRWKHKKNGIKIF